ncbi:leucine-rich repeat protein SHOC-2-like [Topomyia yanbarensis]|uniref:leucine-rich repeat protein SHOC-2-like n=1 Tax=Topomyia yanbarensis TaxID=2498891 RepID=UPI00273B9340|nr:leucine-rich repeat protein SHOC-2-like [Topomyia yanbarensis]
MATSIIIVIWMLGILISIINCRAVDDRRTNEGATHLKSELFSQSQHIDSLQLPKATELILESFTLEHWDSALFSKLNRTRHLTLLNGNIPMITFVSDSLESFTVVQTNLSSFKVIAQTNHGLKTLQLVRNKLRSLPDNLRFLVGLITLDLSQNHLEYIDLNQFSTMKALKNLDLSVNKIRSIEAPADLTFAKMKNLWISYNQLEQFDGFPRSFPALETVRLIGNLWTCSWVDRARKDIMERGIVTFGVDYGCSEHRQGGLCCYGATTSITVGSLLSEGPLIREIQKLTNELAVNPLNMSGEQSLELLTKGSGENEGTILVGVKRDRVKVFF